MADESTPQAAWNHVVDTNVHTLQGERSFARVKPHSVKDNGEVAFWIVEIVNMLGRTEKIAHFASLEAAKKEAEAGVAGGRTEHLYGVNV